MLAGLVLLLWLGSFLGASAIALPLSLLVWPVVFGALIAEWWALPFAAVPAIATALLGLEIDGDPAWPLALLFVTPVDVAAIAIGVIAGRAYISRHPPTRP